MSVPAAAAAELCTLRRLAEAASSMLAVCGEFGQALVAALRVCHRSFQPRGSIFDIACSSLRAALYGFISATNDASDALSIASFIF